MEKQKRKIERPETNVFRNMIVKYVISFDISGILSMKKKWYKFCIIF